MTILAEELLEKPPGHWEPDDFRVARKLLGLTQSGLGGLVGLSRQWVVSIENGHAKPPGALALALKYLLLKQRIDRDAV